MAKSYEFRTISFVRFCTICFCASNVRFRGGASILLFSSDRDFHKQERKQTVATDVMCFILAVIMNDLLLHCAPIGSERTCREQQEKNKHARLSGVMS